MQIAKNAIKVLTVSLFVPAKVNDVTIEWLIKLVTLVDPLRVLRVCATTEAAGIGTDRYNDDGHPGTIFAARQVGHSPLQFYLDFTRSSNALVHPSIQSWNIHISVFVSLNTDAQIQLSFISSPFVLQ